MSTRNLFTLLSIALLVAAPAWCQPEVVVTGLQGPQKIVITPGGNLLASEPSVNPNSGRVSFVTRAGARSSLLEGLPSGMEVAGVGGSGPAGMALRDRTLYLALGAGDSERAPQGLPGPHALNPEGASSPLFASILEFRFDLDIDSTGGPFVMTAQHQQVLNNGGEVEISSDNGGTARVSLLARFAIAETIPNPMVYKFSNPWGMTLTEDGSTLYVTDASMDALVTVDTATGRWRRLRFPPVPNPTPIGAPVLDSVPTSARVYGNQVLVSFLTGFPFVPGNARVLAVNPGTGASELGSTDLGTTEPFIFGLTSVTDVLWRIGSNGQSQFFVLEFSQNQSAQPPPPGRLLRYDVGAAGPQVAAAPLITPVSMAYDAATKDLFILELRGQILRLALD
jgi:hypothetical protein